MAYRYILAVVLSIVMLPAGMAQSGGSVSQGPNRTRIVINGDDGARAFHTRWGYAPAIRAGDFIFMAGVIAGPAPNDGTDTEAFKRGLRRTFAHLKQHLAALGASFEDVIKLNTYHVFDSAHFDGDKLAHMEAVREVKKEYMGAATPAWTAIGVNELFSDAGLVEIELTAYAPE